MFSPKLSYCRIAQKCIVSPVKLPRSCFPNCQHTAMHCQQISLQYVPEYDSLLILSDKLAALHPAS